SVRGERREAPGDAAAAPVRGMQRRAAPLVAADALARAARRARAESAARRARRGGAARRAPAAPSRPAATPGARAGCLGQAEAAATRRPAEPSAPARVASRVECRAAAAPPATRREAWIRERAGAAVRSSPPIPERLGAAPSSPWGWRWQRCRALVVAAGGRGERPGRQFLPSRTFQNNFVATVPSHPVTSHPGPVWFVDRSGPAVAAPSTVPVGDTRS